MNSESPSNLDPLDPAAISTNAIAVENLNFSWKANQVVLCDCSLTVPKGEFWMLLGTNGSGKSTLLKILAGLLEKESGTVEVAGKVGYVFQNPDHQLVMPTVGADVAFGLVDEDISYLHTRMRVERSLRDVGLGNFQRRPIYTLSGGQKQRVALAGALARNSEILLLDEPTALLDRDRQSELVETVRKLVKENHLTALWVTHRLDELDFADGAFLLQDGKVVDRGDPIRLKQLLKQKVT
ncbi:Sulfate-transporting ATPase [Thalassoporum mexicanum PCC 7367]|uniref:ABC transporter ATP-binding protein n=1 Tax=Thalassoporum mexicanum TaxID=3457544 RepID=UPI00029FC184|nr:ABC transporter ATP-binding protein [Pseudanabaena sp. PCC 7367]AFY70431.1 Sulfate-transporting ATPase [Pseudanabaena sp. PCC 7367]